MEYFLVWYFHIPLFSFYRLSLFIGKTKCLSDETLILLFFSTLPIQSIPILLYPLFVCFCLSFHINSFASQTTVEIKSYLLRRYIKTLIYQCFSVDLGAVLIISFFSRFWNYTCVTVMGCFFFTFFCLKHNRL